MADARPTVLITGVSSGIGRASLERLLQEGCDVFGSVRREQDAAKITEEVNGLPGRYFPLVLDVVDPDGISRAVQRVSEVLSGRTLTALINNAGINVAPDPLQYIGLDKFRSQLDVNLIAPVAITQAFLPLLGTDRERQGKPGRIIFMGSIYGSYGLPWQAAYCATKHALEGLSESLRLELRVFGIDVTIIRPGPVSSEIWNKSIKAAKAHEKGTGDWERYADTPYAAAMSATRTYLQQEMESADFYLPCQAIADEVYQVVTASSPAARVVRTSRYMEAWVLPRWTPVRIRDRVIAKRLGIRSLASKQEEEISSDTGAPKKTA